MEVHEVVGKTSWLKKTAAVLRGRCVISGPETQSRSLCLPPCVMLSAGQLCAERCHSLELRDVGTLALIHTHTHTHTPHTRPQVSPLIHSLQGYTHTQTLLYLSLTKLLPSLVTVANLDKLYLTSCGNEMEISVNSMIFSQMCLLSLSKILFTLYYV